MFLGKKERITRNPDEFSCRDLFLYNGFVVETNRLFHINSYTIGELLQKGNIGESMLIVYIRIKIITASSCIVYENYDDLKKKLHISKSTLCRITKHELFNKYFHFAKSGGKKLFVANKNRKIGVQSSFEIDEGHPFQNKIICQKVDPSKKYHNTYLLDLARKANILNIIDRKEKCLNREQEKLDDCSKSNMNCNKHDDSNIIPANYFLKLINVSNPKFIQLKHQLLEEKLIGTQSLKRVYTVLNQEFSTWTKKPMEGEFGCYIHKGQLVIEQKPNRYWINFKGEDGKLRKFKKHWGKKKHLQEKKYVDVINTSDENKIQEAPRLERLNLKGDVSLCDYGYTNQNHTAYVPIDDHGNLLYSKVSKETERWHRYNMLPKELKILVVDNCLDLSSQEDRLRLSRLDSAVKKQQKENELYKRALSYYQTYGRYFYKEISEDDRKRIVDEYTKAKEFIKELNKGRKSKERYSFDKEMKIIKETARTLVSFHRLIEERYDMNISLFEDECNWVPLKDLLADKEKAELMGITGAACVDEELITSLPNNLSEAIPMAIKSYRGILEGNISLDIALYHFLVKGKTMGFSIESLEYEYNKTLDSSNNSNIDNLSSYDIPY